MPSIAPVISPAATPWTAGGSTGSTDVFRAPATAAARRWAPVTGSGEGRSNREKGTPRHGRAHAMHLCASVWPASRPTLYDTGTHTGQLAHARFRHTGQCIQALHMLGERCHREVGTPPNPRLTVRRGPRPRRCLVSWLGCVHRIHWRACPFHVSPPQLFVQPSLAGVLHWLAQAATARKWRTCSSPCHSRTQPARLLLCPQPLYSRGTLRHPRLRCCCRTPTAERCEVRASPSRRDVRPGADAARVSECDGAPAPTAALMKPMCTGRRSLIICRAGPTSDIPLPGEHCTCSTMASRFVCGCS